MSTGRKTQVEKFNAKVRKAQGIEHSLAESKAKAAMEQKDYMKEGEKVLKQLAPAEEVFAVIARSGMEAFIKTWNNSMESVIRETLRTEVRKMIQEEMEAAVTGMFAGMNQAMESMMGQMMPQATDVIFRNPTIQKSEAAIQEEIAEEWDRHEQYMAGEEIHADSVDTVRKATSRKEYNRGSSLGWAKMNVEQAKTRIFELMDEAAREHGIDIAVGKAFKRLGGKYNTAYQKAIPIIFGVVQEGETGRGRWELLVEMYNHR